jgi:hypothetical protein
MSQESKEAGVSGVAAIEKQSAKNPHCFTGTIDASDYTLTMCMSCHLA